MSNDPYKQSYPGYPPQDGYQPQAGYPPPQGYPQPGYPPQQGFGQPGPVQPGYMPAPGGVPYGHVPPPPTQHIPYSDNSTEPIVKGFEFSDESIRRGFIRKVYSILSIQLLVTLGVVFLFSYHQGTREFAFRHTEMFWVALILMLVTVIALSCCEGVRRTAPHNFIALGLFTLAESYLVGMSTIRFEADLVLMAVGITAAVCIGLTIFAFQTKWDFTMMGGILFVFVLLLMLFGLIAIFTRSSTVHLIYSCCGALLFSVYLIYDTQMMMGGTHKYSISPEEYIFGALTLYLDIINIFLYILSILGSSKD